MRVPIDDALREICRMIVEKDKTEDQWAEIESDDMFQEGPFVGGYDAEESEFCFSYYANDGCEYWFQLSLEQAGQIEGGRDVHLETRNAVDPPNEQSERSM